MGIRDMTTPAYDKIPVNHVLLSAFDKRGINIIVPAILAINPKCMFYSTTGTLETLQGDPERLEKLGLEKHFLTPEQVANNVVAVEDFTEFPEMDGGLVKTLHPKIHAGILGERNNPKHQEYLKDLAKTVRFLDTGVERVFDAKVGQEYRIQVIEGIRAVYFDMFIGNLYPFADVIAQKGVTFEKAKGNVDIGGTAIIRAGAKNHLSCAVIVDPVDCIAMATYLRENDGCTDYEKRFELMKKAFEHTADYEDNIRNWLKTQTVEDAKKCYKFIKMAERGK